MRLTILSITLWLATPLLADTYENEAHGFRFAPGSGAEARETAANPPDRFVVQVRPTRPAGPWQILIRVAPVEPLATARVVRQRSIDFVARDPRYREPRAFEHEGDGRKIPGLSVTGEFGGHEYRINAYYVVANHLRYILQCSAPASSYDAHRETLETIVSSFRSFPIPEEQLRENGLRGLAARCGSEIEWAPRWEVAARQARDEGKLVLVVARIYPGFDLSDNMAAGPLFDRDIVSLIAHRFVSLRLDGQRDVPFASPALYGMGPMTFGEGYLAVTPDGEVVAETQTASVMALDRFLREVAIDPTPRVAEEKRIEAARRLHDRGELKLCLELLAETDDPEELRLLASCHRRLGRHPGPLQALRDARERAPASLSMDLNIEKAEVCLKMGRTGSALGLLRPAMTREPDHPRVAEAKMLAARAHLALGEDPQAEALLQEIIRDHPQERWAWQAAAVMTSTARRLGLRSRLEWPDRSLLEFARVPSRAAPEEGEHLEQAAVEYLLEHQRSDGTWIYPGELSASPENPPDPLAHAISAAAARSLVPHRSDPRVRKAIERALRGVLEMRAETRRASELVHYMDYWVWTKAYQLWFLADCWSAGVGERPQLRETMAELVAELEKRQRPSGGWSYYVTRNLDSGQHDRQSISFVTGPVILALLRAKECSVDVPAGMIDLALDGLQAMANPNGAFGYMGGVGYGGGINTALPGAAGRGPICALALHEGKRIARDGVRDALAHFAEYRNTLAREQGKVLLHTGPEGQGSHYVLFDYAGAALATKALPAGERAPFAEMLRELVLRCRYEDGGYMDNQSLGRVYGTAMALTVFEAFGRPEH